MLFVDKLDKVWVFYLYCFSDSYFCCSISADPQPASSQTYRGLFEEQGNESFFKCLSMYVCQYLEQGTVVFPTCVVALWEGISVTSPLGSDRKAAKFLYLAICYCCVPCLPCVIYGLSCQLSFSFPF